MKSSLTEELLPLTSAQRGLFLHAEFEREQRGPYLVQYQVELHGTVIPDQLRMAARAMLQRHGSLRTTFRYCKSGAPMQIIRRTVPLDWAEHRVEAGLPAAVATERAEQLVREDWNRGLNAEDATLIRFVLIQLDEEHWRLIITYHYLIMDGWSMTIFLRELFTVYANGPAGLPPAPLYVRHLRSMAERNRSAAERAWEQVFSDFTDSTIVAPAASCIFKIPNDMTLDLSTAEMADVRAIAHQSGFKLNTFCQGAWAIVVGNLTGSEDVAFGSTVSGRPADLPGAESMIGMLANTVPVRVSIQPWQTFRMLLARIQDQRLNLSGHDHLGLTDIQQVSGAKTALFDTTIFFENLPAADYLSHDRIGITVKDVRFRDTSHYPITLVVNRGEQFKLRLRYRADLFAQDTMARLGRRLLRVLRTMAANLDEQIGAADVLNHAERQQLLIAKDPAGPIGSGQSWDRTSGQGCAHEVLASQAQARPDALAVICGTQALTYGELDARANAVAWLLRDFGVGPGVPVAACVERSLDMVVGLLAVLKAGGVYVPLDPEYPVERTRFVLGDTGAPVVLTTRTLAQGLENGQARILLLDEQGPDGVRTDAPPPRAGRRDLAYVIYTSGSTGKPKGVMVEHASLTSHLGAIAEAFAYTEDDRTLVFASAAFDVSIEQMLAPLVCGATAVIRTDDVVAPKDLIRSVHDHSITVLNLTPVYLEALLREGADLDTVRLVISGGDIIRSGVVQAARTSLSGKRVLNAYGPTETTITAMIQDVGEVAEGAPVPIGRPLPGTRVYLVDEDGEEAGPGKVGEIVIGGDRVARGYLNQPILTAKQFVPDRFSSSDGRLYRTGDLGRWLPDGSLEFLGRVDDQVKIRGYRIELGEVESALAALPRVTGAVVVARPDSTGDDRLIGYVTTTAETGDPAELREVLLAVLPKYMVPSIVVELDAFPLTPNGKVDRNALPEPTSVRSSTSELSTEPTNSSEALLAAIWAEVLQVDNVGVHDNFFDLGGHSLLAFQLSSRASAATGTDVPLRVVFEHPTVADMAAVIGSLLPVTDGAPVPTRCGERTEGPLSAGQERLWVIQSLDPSAHHYNVPSLWHLSGEVDAKALEEALNGLVRRHEILRTLFVNGEDGPRQVVQPAEAVRFCLSREPIEFTPGGPGDGIPTKVRAFAEEPFDLSTAPLVRTRLFTDYRHPADVLFLLVFHHIAIDGSSLTTVMRELETLYRQAAGEPHVELAEPGLQYLDFAVWAKQQPTGEARREADLHLAYWREQLKGLASLELPTDRPRPPFWSGHGASMEFMLPTDVVLSLRRLGSEENSSSFMVLLAAFQAVLACWSGQRDIAVGAPMTGRSLPDLKDLVGFLTDTMVLRCVISSQRTFREVLGDVRAATLGAMKHNLVSYGQVVEELQPERHLDRNPVFQVFFSHETQNDMPHWVLPRAEVTHRDWPTSSAQFDLDLTCTESKEQIFCSLTYATDLFDAASVERFSSDFQSFLRFLAKSGGPDTAIAEWQLSLALAEGEQRG
ncbi:amino acid adenylation domain-containing protein [Streptomyces sp. NPDC007094]|uniref:amino acid adenylation domain-containing protein n=1 Tax=Streptomyces sp. NPDC007094 TaxID=3155359 RepID=UPI00340704AB